MLLNDAVFLKMIALKSEFNWLQETGDPTFPISERLQPIDFINLCFPDTARVSSEIAHFYQEGLSLRDVARKVNLSKTRVRTLLIRAGVELRAKISVPTATGWRKSGKQAVRPFYGFCFQQGKIIRDPKEYSVLLLIHEKWKQGVNSNSIATYLERVRRFDFKNSSVIHSFFNFQDSTCG